MRDKREENMMDTTKELKVDEKENTKPEEKIGQKTEEEEKKKLERIERNEGNERNELIVVEPLVEDKVQVLQDVFEMKRVDNTPYVLSCYHTDHLHCLGIQNLRGLKK